MRITQRPCSVLLPLLLAACATTSLPSAHVRPGQTPMTPPAARLSIGPTAPAVGPPLRPAPSDVWARLRGSFAMEGCDANPAVLPLAQRYTRNPRRFEARMQAALPRLVYVQESAAEHGVAGEFALLPWVESHYQSASVRPNRPAGIWQIMPATAGAMGLRMSRTYDGRLDLAASTDGVMRLLHRYHQRYGDWSLADHAYNAGESGMRQRFPSGKVPKTGRRTGTDAAASDHLVKLLAIACVVREPARFHVTLPGLPAGQHLVTVTVEHSMPLAQAAVHAGMTTAALTDLNAAFRNGVVDTRYADQLLLPKSRAARFREATQALAVAGDAHVASDVPALAPVALASATPSVSAAVARNAQGAGRKRR